MAAKKPYLTAGDPLDHLLDRLASQGWGALHGRHLSIAVLDALKRTLDPVSGRGEMTHPRLAAVAGYSLRSMYTAVRELESMGLLVRPVVGGVDKKTGRTTKSEFLVVKKRLVSMIASAVRRSRDRVLALVRERTARLAARRQAGLGVWPTRYNRRSVHAAIGAGVTPLRVESPGGGGAPPPMCEHGRRGSCPFCPGGRLYDVGLTGDMS